LAPGRCLRIWQIRSPTPLHATLLRCSIRKPLLARLLVCSEHVSRSATRYLALPRLSALTCHVPLPLLALLPKQNGRPANARIFTRSLITRPLSDRLLLPHLSASGACGLEESPALHSLSTLHHPPLPPSTTPSLRHSTYHSRTSVHLLSLCYG
jgi:hypothetical protein